ncbi:hypothetical protein [uncultured Friedmanniella sp.]|uniref:hypothetical protein n=1 Tax=uncultured Friedmanniella sp. TaxID=335381 RepID=UPI0035CC7325
MSIDCQGAPHLVPGSAAPEIRRPPRALGDGSGTADRVGRYVWRLCDDYWSWSPYLFQLFGYGDRAAVPSTQLWLQHLADSDRAAGEHLQAELRRGVRSFSWRHGIHTSSGRVRTVVESGWVLGGDLASAVCHGQVNDITAALNSAADEAVRASSRSRESINQLQGALMFSHGLAPHPALQLLIWHSQTYNVKLATLAQRAAAELPSLRAGASDLQSAMDRLLLDAAVGTAGRTGRATTWGHRLATDGGDCRPGGSSG